MQIAGTSNLTGAMGDFRIQDVPRGNATVQVTKSGYQGFEQSVNIDSAEFRIDIGNLRKECSTWPADIRPVMSRLRLPPGLCLIRQPNGRGSSYDQDVRTVYLRSGSPVGGELDAMAHELFHAHQHQHILESGLPDPSIFVRDSMVNAWVQTREGRRFVELAGWRETAGRWVENCERWSCGYPNPLEDAAVFMTVWFNPNGVHGSPNLERDAPQRSRWASEFFSR